ncbi:MAG: hypothetical protein IJS96_07235 [Schwartzia sp.]|nr:hypothetical protein [Schwartzia sp. (in: firmicutes)]
MTAYVKRHAVAVPVLFHGHVSSLPEATGAKTRHFGRAPIHGMTKRQTDHGFIAISESAVKKSNSKILNPKF